MGWVLYPKPKPKTQKLLYPNPKPKNIYNQTQNQKFFGYKRLGYIQYTHTWYTIYTWFMYYTWYISLFQPPMYNVYSMSMVYIM